MTLVQACSWQHNQTHSKLWKKHFLWVISRCDTKKKPSCGLKGTWSQYKRQMNCLCIPLCLFKYWNTKSFRGETMLRGLQSKWDSLHENKFFQILGCVWAHVCVTSAKPAGIGSCKTAVFRSRADEQLESTQRMCGGLIECFLGGGYIHAWCFANRAHVPFKVFVGLSCLYPTQSMGLNEHKAADFTLRFNAENEKQAFQAFHSLKITADC